MKMPHTHYTRGKHVKIVLRDGSEHIGKFVERKGRFVVLDSGKFTTAQIQRMGFAPLAPYGAESLTLSKSFTISVAYGDGDSREVEVEADKDGLDIEGATI